MTEGPLPDRKQPLNVTLRRNPALSAASKTRGGGGRFTPAVGAAGRALAYLT
jgi:hypothetical protein